MNSSHLQIARSNIISWAVYAFLLTYLKIINPKKKTKKTEIYFITVNSPIRKRYMHKPHPDECKEISTDHRIGNLK